MEREKKSFTHEEKQRLDLRFHDFLGNVWSVAKLIPKEKYLYPVMMSVPWRDLEVRLDMAIIEHKGSYADQNDNDNKDTASER